MHRLEELAIESPGAPSSVTAERFAWERAVRRPREENGLSRTARLFALVLATFWDRRTNRVRVSRSTLMEACDWKDHKSIQSQIKVLVRAGFLGYVPGRPGGVSSVYQLMLPTNLVPEPAPVAEEPMPVEQPAEALVPDAKRAAHGLYWALEHRGHLDLRDRVSSEDSDWEALHQAIMGQANRGWDVHALLLAATEGQPVPQAEIRTSVSRLYAARIAKLPHPNAYRSRSGHRLAAALKLGAAKAPHLAAADSRQQRDHAIGQLEALHPDALAALVARLNPVQKITYETLGLRSVAPALFMLLAEAS